LLVCHQDNQDELQTPVLNGDESTIVDADLTSCNSSRRCSSASRRRSHQEVMLSDLATAVDAHEMSLIAAGQFAVLESDPSDRDPRLNEVKGTAGALDCQHPLLID
jgi:hypothetical protein